MKLIEIPRLRLAQLQTLCELSIAICKSIVEVATILLKVESLFQTFQTAMLKVKASASEKQGLDHTRDDLLSGFLHAVYGENKFPHEDETIAKSRDELVKVADKHDFKIIRLPNDEETAAIHNLLADIAKLDITPLVPTGLTRWIPLIETANNNYKVATKDYISGTTEVAATQWANKLAPELKDELEELYATLFGAIKMGPTDQLRKAYAELETLVDSMR